VKLLHHHPRGIGHGATARGVSNSNVYLSLNRKYPNTTPVTGSDAYLKNLETTLPYRIRCYNNLDPPEGQLLSSLDADGDTIPDTYDYFVVIYADDYKIHHVAKITSILTSDVVGDTFEFEPQLSEDVPLNTKFAIYEGPPLTGTGLSVVAIAYGLLGKASGGDGRHDVFTHFSRPTAYFYEDRLDNKNQLNHNTKYKMLSSKYDGTTESHGQTCFRTEKQYSNYIQDYGPYTMPATLIDLLRTYDDVGYSASSTTKLISNEHGASALFYNIDVDFTEWADCFRNIQRTTDNKTHAGVPNTTDTFTGEKRYVRFIDSPDKSNFVPMVMDAKIYNSVTKTGSYAEARIIDTTRIMGKKIKQFDPMVVKQRIASGNIKLDALFALPGNVDLYMDGANLIAKFKNLQQGEDIRLLLQRYISGVKSYYEEIKIGDYYFRFSPTTRTFTTGEIDSPTKYPGDNYISQKVRLDAYKYKGDTNYSQTVSNVTISTNNTVYRKTWGAITKTLMVDFKIDTNIIYNSIPIANEINPTFSGGSDIIKYASTNLAAYSESRINNLELILSGAEYTGKNMKVKYGDIINKYVKLYDPVILMYQPLVSDNITNYEVPNYLDYFEGVYTVDKIIFVGSVETFEDYIQDGMMKYYISGRNDVSKLLGPITNKSYAYSGDYVYSTLGPFVETVDTGATKKMGAIVAGIDSTIVISYVEALNPGVAANVLNLEPGQHIFTEDGDLIGRIYQVAFAPGIPDINITLQEPSLVNLSIEDKIFKEVSFIRSGTLYSKNNIFFGKAIASNPLASSTTTNLMNTAQKGLMFNAGMSINKLTGATSISLISSSSSDNVSAVGYYINSPNKTIYSDTTSITFDGITDSPYFSKLADESGSSTVYKELSTISSLNDYYIISVDTGADNSVIELAPTSPAILARVDNNPKHSSFENYTDTGETILGLDGLDVPILTEQYFEISTNTEFTNILNNEYYYIGPEASGSNGVFSLIGKVLKVYKESVAAGGDAWLVIDRLNEVAIAVNDKLYKKSSIVHGLYYLNTQGLRKGGMLQLVNSSLRATRDGSRKKPIMFSQQGGNADTTDDYINRYGSFMWRYIDLQTSGKGSIFYRGRRTTGITKGLYSFRKPGSINAYSPAFRVYPGYQMQPKIITVNENKTFSSKISGITRANPCTVTATAHGFSDGDRIIIRNVGGMIEVNNRLFLVDLIDVNSFRLNDAEGLFISTVDYTTYTKGGRAYNESDNYKRQGSPETKGLFPAMGSNFQDTTVSQSAKLQSGKMPQYRSSTFGGPWGLKQDGTNQLKYEIENDHFTGPMGYVYNPIVNARNYWEMADSKAHSWFIFAPSDLYPDSMNREHHIGSINRNFSDFDLILQGPTSKEPSLEYHEKYTGSINRTIELDSSFERVSISSASITTNNIKRFGLLRLIELTYDWHFNAVDPENPPSRKEHIGLFEYVLYQEPTNGGAITSFNDTTNTFTMASVTHFIGSEGYALFTDNGDFIGIIDSIDAVALTIIIDARARKINGKLYTSGDLYYVDAGRGNIHNKSYYKYEVYGRQGESTLMGAGEDRALSMLQGFIFYGASTFDGDFTRVYGINSTDEIHRYFHTPINAVETGSWVTGTLQHILLPPAFECEQFTSPNPGTEFDSANQGDAGFPWVGVYSSMRPPDWKIGDRVYTMYGKYVGALGLKTAVHPGGDISVMDNTGLNVNLAAKYIGTNEYGDILKGKGCPVNTFSVSHPLVYNNKIIFNKTLGDDPMKYTDGTTTVVGTTFYTSADRIDWGQYYADLTQIFTVGVTFTIENTVDNNGVFTVSSSNYNSTEANKTVIFVDENTVSEIPTATRFKVHTIITPPVNNWTHPSRVCEGLAEIMDCDANTNASARGPSIYGSEGKVAFLDRFRIEGSGGYKIGEGATSSISNTTSGTKSLANPIYNINNQADTNAWGGYLIEIDKKFAAYTGANSEATSATSITNTGNIGDGVSMVFKPVLDMSDPEAVASNQNTESCLIKIETTFAGRNKWIRYCPNLTGMYLVSEKGFNLGGNSEDTAEPINNRLPSHIHYIISHEVERDVAAEVHYLLIDTPDGAHLDSLKYRIMKPAEVCLWPFSPSNINLYSISSRYTKKAFKEETYTQVPHIEYYVKSSEGDDHIVDKTYESDWDEAVLSMYVVVDMDPKTNETKIVPRNYSYMFGPGLTYENQKGYTFLLNDGVTQQVRNILMTIEPYATAKKCTLNLSESVDTEMVGIVSFGEIFTITTVRPIQMSNPIKTAIASSVTICDEVEDIVNDLMESNNIVYTKTSTDYPYFTAPIFTGVDIYSASNFVAGFKGKRVIAETTGIKIRPDTLDLDYTGVHLSYDKGNTNIISVSRNKTLFDFYNEIIVYGTTARGIKRNRKSIKEVGRKTLEEVDETLITQSEVDKRAQDLLNIHSLQNERFTIKLTTQELELTKAGDIITLDFPTDNIPRNQYVILEMRRDLGGLIELEIGAYNKTITDRLAELFTTNKKLAALAREKKHKNISDTIDILDTLQIKEIRIKITSTSRTYTIGFSNTLGFSNTIGFGGEVVTVEYEEDLT